MADLGQHRTVRFAQLRARPPRNEGFGGPELRKLCLEAGADDVGFVRVNHPALAGERETILEVFPKTRSIISFVCRMNVEPIRLPARSIANLEFHGTGDRVNEVGHSLVASLAKLGVKAINPPMGFPMEMQGFPGKVWAISLKPLAVAAGLGHMGVHRNVIHPKFGNFILLGAVLIDVDIREQSEPIDFNPCLECNLCVAACPVGAISANGDFNFASCYTHNYREFMSGFTDWAENIADSHGAAEYRRRLSDGESASMWQSLSFGANYKAAYCISVCPAGEEVIGPFLDDRPAFLQEVVKPLQNKKEAIYVRPSSDAEAHVARRFPHKTVKHVGRVLRPASIAGFIYAMKHVFQPGQSKGLNAVFHFRFTGAESAECTVTIQEQAIAVCHGWVGESQLRITANSASWLDFLRGDANIAWLLLTLRVRLRGDPRLLIAFGKCFP